MKAKLRTENLLKRLSHNPQEKELKDSSIVSKISKISKFKTAKAIMFYLPIKGEVDLTKLFEKHKTNKKFILPRIKNKTLELIYIENLKDVEKGKYSILEPKKHLKEANPKTIDLILVPGIAFAKNGHRVGYGQGFYDKLLKKTTTFKIGIAYDFQIVKNIKGQKHDIPMNMIVTEKQEIKIPKIAQTGRAKLKK